MVGASGVAVAARDGIRRAHLTSIAALVLFLFAPVLYLDLVVRVCVGF